MSTADRQRHQISIERLHEINSTIFSLMPVSETSVLVDFDRHSSFQ